MSIPGHCWGSLARAWGNGAMANPGRLCSRRDQAQSVRPALVANGCGHRGERHSAGVAPRSWAACRCHASGSGSAAGGLSAPASVAYPTLLTPEHFFVLVPQTDWEMGPRGRVLGPKPGFAHPHFERVELQRERRKRQPQVIQLSGPRVFLIGHAEFRVRFARAPSRRSKPAGRREFGAIVQPAESGVAAGLAAAGCARSGCCTTGNCSTVTRCPSQSSVTST